ncbi:glycosyltransferase family 2 protein [Fundicoccus ignavus]|uniref:Glycosyltransferase n=1 Tax=Fundicoccus ignavus TaxID=2664442 RepID=A0A844BYU6_9LACT|nr:glycosyltransferase family 2 protein [Fundicoccus ignavus]MRJ46082.1 glycosyltransferase [Fundicoccus ignavus]
MKKNTISIVVPCYNEARTLQAFVAEILAVQAQLPKVFLELILVNDGSADETLGVMRALASEHPNRISYLSFSRNFGKEAAMLAGFEHAAGEWVAVMDADLQDPPEMLLEMHQLITTTEYDVVATRRVSREGEPKVRSLFATMYYKLNNLISDVKIEEGARDYRLMTRPVIEAILSLPERNRFSKGLFSWVGFEVKYLEYPNIERQAGETSWSFTKLFDYAIEGLISFSDVPLTLASYVGLLTFVMAFVYGVYIVIRTLIFGAATPGWPSLAVLVVGMGGLQLLCLGIVGKYIGKIFIENKQRPMYILKEVHLHEEDDKA